MAKKISTIGTGGSKGTGIDKNKLIDDVIQEAENEIFDEMVKDAKVKLKDKLREQKKVQLLLNNITREIAEIKLEIGQQIV